MKLFISSFSLQASSQRWTNSCEHLKSKVSNLGICPIGSPKADVSISYWTNELPITTSPGYISMPIPPATPTFITLLTLYSLINIWVQTAALTLPIPHTTATTSWPQSVPWWKVILALVSLDFTSMSFKRISNSSLIAAIIPKVILNSSSN